MIVLLFYYKYLSFILTKIVNKITGDNGLKKPIQFWWATFIIVYRIP